MDAGGLTQNAVRNFHLNCEPGQKEPIYTPAKFGDTHSDYVYVSGLGAYDHPDYVLVFDDEWNHDGYGVNVAGIAGRVEWMTISRLHELLAKQEKELAAQGRKMKLLRPAWSAWPDPSVSDHPLAGPRPWYRRPIGSGVIVGILAGLVTALVMSAVTAWRRRRSGHGGRDDSEVDNQPAPP